MATKKASYSAFSGTSLNNQIDYSSFIGTATQTQTKSQFSWLGSLDLTQNLGDRLLQINRIGAAVPTPIDPVYKKTSNTFSVLNQVSTPFALFKHARINLDDLRLELRGDRTDNLKGKLTSYIDGLYEHAIQSKDVELEKVLDRYFGKYRTPDGFALPELEEAPSVDDDPEFGIDYQHVNKLFVSGKLVRSDIQLVEELRDQVAQFRKYQQQKLQWLESQLAEVETEIPDALRQLVALNGERLEALGDYQVVRQLVAENWTDVARRYAERENVLNNHKGLHYVRVRETPVSRPPDDSLPLRHFGTDDLVPGCPMEDRELPAELDTFMDAVLEIPVSDWRALASQYRLLPARRRLQKLVEYRSSRLQFKVNHAPVMVESALASRMQTLRVQNQAVVRAFAQRPLLAANTLVAFQRSASQLLSLQDLLEGPPHRLRGTAASLRDRLDQACHCLLDQLRQVSPSIRLDWARAAERDSLPVESPQRWPGLEKAQTQDFNGIRTVIDLVNWWFRQLIDSADSSSFSAQRNMLRAILMVAADDDPNAIVHGHLKTMPGQFQIGSALRLQLNREALPGTLLQMVDQNKSLVGVLRVDDHDADGAVATVTRLVSEAISPSSQFTVTGYTQPGLPRL